LRKVGQLFVSGRRQVTASRQVPRVRVCRPFNAWPRDKLALYRAGGFYMKVSRLVSAVFVVLALGMVSLSLTACQSTGDMSSSGASSGGTSGSSGGY
jgi:hypothetical protein